MNNAEQSAERIAEHEFQNPKLLEGLFQMATFDWTNLIASVDAVVENFIASRFPKSSALEPELNAAVEANIALAKKVMDQYALAKLTTLAGTALDSIATKYPAAAPEIAAVKAKLTTLGAAL